MSFKHKPFLKQETLNTYQNELEYIENSITEKLKDYTDFDGIDFCDVGARGIQIRGHHKQIKGYTFGDQITIEYDFSNTEKCIEKFVSMWKKCDTTEYVRWYKGFLADGEKYGWD